MIKSLIRGGIDFWTTIRVQCLKLKARFLGDYVINKYIENCSERQIKRALYLLGAEVDSTSNFKGGLIFDNTNFNYGNLRVEGNCYIGKKVFMDMVAPIIVKKDAVISAGVTILTHQDVGERMLKEYFERKVGSVVLDEGCWIGANATILNSIRIGKCAVVAAGAVVNRDVEDFTVVGGVPARVIKRLK
jgi:acetyltransferase-like isoleucine patch superfamily enzyme